MIVIQRIKIKNFRSIVDETIDLTDFNCFVGKNDSGKSNVLKALNLFFNNETDHATPFDFKSDYSYLAKESAHHAKEIKITLEILVPDTYLEKGIKQWTKIWREEGLHYNNIDSLFDQSKKGITFLNRISYLYIPAVKSTEYFKDLLSKVYSSMTKSANSKLKSLNEKYSTRLQELTQGLSNQLQNVLHMESAIQMPSDLNTLFRDLSFSTSDGFVRNIDLSRRGDGIRARHIPSILIYMQTNMEENRLKKSIGGTYIWGFEEPENGVEYMSCFEMADELYSYRNKCQLLITTHSPAFYAKSNETDVSCYYVKKDGAGASKYLSGARTVDLDKEMGLMPLVTPYILEERSKYLSEKARLENAVRGLEQQLNAATGTVIIITEGKTDAKHLATAFSNLGCSPHLLRRIKYYDFSSGISLGDDIIKLLDKLSNIPSTGIVIGILDRDKHLPNNPERYYKLGNGVFKFNIPALENDERTPEDKISIEHYFSDSEIKTVTPFGRMYLGSDFNEYGDSSDGFWHYNRFDRNESIRSNTIIDKNCNKLDRRCSEASIITKDEFANYVASHPNDFNFNNFTKIWELIWEIVSTAEAPNEGVEF